MATATPQGAADWTLINPPGEGFSIQMPVKPEEQTQQVPLMGNNYQMRLYTGVEESTGLLYMVIMQEFPTVAGGLQPSARLEHFMGGFKEGLVKSMGTAPGVNLEILPDRDINLKDYIGRQYTLSVRETHGLVRAYDGPQRIYVLLVLGGDEKNSSVGRFLNSFEIKAAPAPVPRPIVETKPA
jgi:hypothetical protein